MTLLLHLTLKPERRPRTRAPAFPFSVPAIRTLPDLDLTAPVTFLVGENGSGKSTLLEAIAAKAELPTLGSSEVAFDDSLAAQRELGEALHLVWRRRTRRGFYLRAEDFFGYLKRMARDDARIERERGFVSASRNEEAAAAVHPDEVGAARHLGRYDARSHGESFIDLFQSRVHGEGLYLLDEPEAPLSPQRQLALLCLIMEAARAGAQFVIATHSPILLAVPGARIYSFDSTPVSEMPYEDLEHVKLTREFLANPSLYLRHLSA